LHNNLCPDICFNPYDSTFMVTYFDSTAQKLPFLTHHFNMNSPDQWNIISPGYNDSTNLSAPYPKVALNFGLHTGANAWIAERSGGNGVAMFDSRSSTWTGVSDANNPNRTRLFGAYPNPTANNINISFFLDKTEKVTITVMNILGQPLGIITCQIYTRGRHAVPFDVSGFPPGTYLYGFNAGDHSSCGKFAVVR
jgi:hypothetical protein